MKKIFLCATIAVAMCFASCEGFDASEILDRLDNLENQFDDLKNNEENNQGGDNSDNQGGGDSGNEDSADNNKIYYTTSDNTKLFPKTDASLYGAILISNTYKDGQGVLTFDDAVTSIGDTAFQDCTSLTSVTIPDSVISIGGSAFESCTSLTRVDIIDLSAWCKIGFGSASANPLRNGAKFYLNGSELTDITIPSDITEIKAYAFLGCTSLTSITIPDSVTSIGDNAFLYCSSLPIIDNIRYADTYLIGVTDNSQTVYSISENTRFIGNGAFSGCTSLTSVTIPDSVTSIGKYAFRYCDSLTSVTIGNSVTSIGSGAFYDCRSLTEVYCKPTTPPAVHYNYNYTANCSFQFNSGMKIYVPRDSYDAYMQYDNYSNGMTAQTNWRVYESYIEPYDFK